MSLWIRDPKELSARLADAPPRIGGFDIDITPQKRAEAELERSRLALQQSEKLSAMGSQLLNLLPESVEESIK